MNNLVKDTDGQLPPHETDSDNTNNNNDDSLSNGKLPPQTKTEVGNKNNNNNNDNSLSTGKLPHHENDSDNRNNNYNDNTLTNNDCSGSICRPKENLRKFDLDLDLDCLFLDDLGQESDKNLNNCTDSGDLHTEEIVDYNPGSFPRGRDNEVSACRNYDTSTEFISRLLDMSAEERSKKDAKTNHKEESESDANANHQEIDEIDANTNFALEHKPGERKDSGDSKTSSTISRQFFQRKASHRKSRVTLPPTYIMDPRPDQKFNPGMGERLVRHTVKKTLEGYVYSGESAPVKSMMVSEIVVDTAKMYLSPRFPRYRWVCHVTMVQNTGQTLFVADKFMWDKTLDNYASYTHRGRAKEGNYICV